MFLVLVTKYLLSVNTFRSILFYIILLTSTVLLVFRGVGLGVWTAPPRLILLGAHRCPLLLAGGTSRNSTSANASCSQQTHSQQVLSSVTQSRLKQLSDTAMTIQAPDRLQSTGAPFLKIKFGIFDHSIISLEVFVSGQRKFHSSFIRSQKWAPS